MIFLGFYSNPSKAEFSNFRRLLNGKIEIEPPNKIFTRFFGFLKLKNDPQSEQLSYIHFIPRGAKIINAWFNINIIHFDKIIIF